MYIIARFYGNTMDYIDKRGRIVRDAKNLKSGAHSPMVYHKESNILKRLDKLKNEPGFKKVSLDGDIVDLYFKTGMEMELTSNEKKVIKAYKDDDFVSDLGWRHKDAATYVKDFHQDAGLDGKAFSGTMASLAKKKVIWTDGWIFGLTETGKNIAEKL